MYRPANVSVLGAGAMGHGLAVQFAHADHSVTLVDHCQENIDTARDQIREAVSFLESEELTERSPADVVEEIDYTLDADERVGSADVVLETIPEDLMVPCFAPR